MRSAPRVYVACLAAYNAGELHGAWMDVPSDADELAESMAGVLKSSPVLGAEEWAIHDHEGFQGVRIPENPDLEWLVAVAALISRYGELGAKLMAHLALEPAEASAFIEDNHQGAWGTPAEWAEDFLEDTGALRGLDERLRGYFDFESYARDCLLNGDAFTIETDDGRVHIFSRG